VCVCVFILLAASSITHELTYHSVYSTPYLLALPFLTYAFILHVSLPVCLSSLTFLSLVAFHVILMLRCFAFLSQEESAPLIYFLVSRVGFRAPLFFRFSCAVGFGWVIFDQLGLTHFTHGHPSVVTFVV
jgi:hypothetical protein